MPNGEKPIEWVLYTNHPIDTMEDALLVEQGYMHRWRIEVFFARGNQALATSSPRNCTTPTTLKSVMYDRLYAQLRSLAPHTIRTRHMTEYVSPHRGGWGIHLRWDTVECSITDILQAREAKTADGGKSL